MTDPKQVTSYYYGQLTLTEEPHKCNKLPTDHVLYKQPDWDSWILERKRWSGEVDGIIDIEFCPFCGQQVS